MNGFKIGSVSIGDDEGLFLIAGPCVIESLENCLQIADALVELADNTGIGVIFKASFDKANRSSVDRYRGPGLDKGLKILETVRSKTGLAITTDVHEPCQAEPVAQIVDAIQIPAFLCRQTDLLAGCAKTNKPVSVKKGQFVSPEEMANVVEKMRAFGNDKIMLTERGTFFGYNRLVNDFSGIATMQSLGCPVLFDATHSTQQPGGLGTESGGQRKLAPVLAKAAVAAGANGLFIETHPDPENAMCDAACQMPLEWLDKLVRQCMEIYQIVRTD
ncbi:MAG: 3-deoxy-8-phosphooctulonate synthase [Planctomycetes bacterium]|nr:3-deoxy-8-phosphooctulonate synthase [Planctomycetota bacterium]